MSRIGFSRGGLNSKDPRRQRAPASGRLIQPRIKTETGFQMAPALFPERDDSQLKAVDPELDQPGSCSVVAGAVSIQKDSRASCAG